MLNRHSLLAAFERAPEGRLSGQALAARLGLTRTAVWKHVEALRRDGFPIEGSGRLGYHFQGVADFSLAHPSRLKALIPHYVLRTTSTQAQARQGAAAGLPEGHVWISEIQTAGRGRLERPWESGFGGLWFSLLLRPKIAVASAPPLALVAALALTGVLRRRCGIQAKVKKPNDVMVQAGARTLKIAGILTEMSGEADRVSWMVMGIGLNVHNRLSPALSSTATTLQALTAQRWARADLLNAFWKQFLPAYKRFQKHPTPVDVPRTLLVS